MPYDINVIKTIKLFDPKITHIDLSEFETIDENVQQLIEALTQNPYIQSIYGIDRNKWSLTNFHLFADTILKEIPSILSISDNTSARQESDFLSDLDLFFDIPLMTTEDFNNTRNDADYEYHSDTDNLVYTSSNTSSEHNSDNEDTIPNEPTNLQISAVDVGRHVDKKIFYKTRNILWDRFITKLENRQLTEIDLTAQLFLMTPKQLEALKNALTAVKDIIKKINLSNNPIYAKDFCSYFEINFTALESINLKNLPIGMYLNQSNVSNYGKSYNIVINWITIHLKELILFKFEIHEKLVVFHSQIFSTIFAKLNNSNCHLENLSIAGAPLDDKGLNILTYHINSTKSLTSFNIYDLYKISDENLAKLLISLKNCHHLNYLQLSLTGNQAAEALANLLKHNLFLQHLRLKIISQNTSIVLDDVETFHDLSIPILESLVIAKNKIKTLALTNFVISFIDDKGYVSTEGDIFFKLLEDNNNLEALSLQNSNFFPNDYAKLLQLLSKTKIQFFDIYQFEVYDWVEEDHEKFLTALANLFTWNCSLKIFKSIYAVGETIKNLKKKLPTIYQALTLNTNITSIILSQHNSLVQSESDTEDSEFSFLDWLNGELEDKLRSVCSRNARIANKLLTFNFTSDPDKQLSIINYLKRGFFIPRTPSIIHKSFPCQKPDSTVSNMLDRYLGLQLACLDNLTPKPDEEFLEDFLKINKNSITDLEKQENAFKLCLKAILSLNKKEENVSRNYLTQAFEFSPAICHLYLHSCKKFTDSTLWKELAELAQPIFSKDKNIVQEKSNEKFSEALEFLKP